MLTTVRPTFDTFPHATDQFASSVDDMESWVYLDANSTTPYLTNDVVY